MTLLDAAVYIVGILSLIAAIVSIAPVLIDALFGLSDPDGRFDDVDELARR